MVRTPYMARALHMVRKLRRPTTCCFTSPKNARTKESIGSSKVHQLEMHALVFFCHAAHASRTSRVPFFLLSSRDDVDGLGMYLHNLSEQKSVATFLFLMRSAH